MAETLCNLVKSEIDHFKLKQSGTFQSTNGSVTITGVSINTAKDILIIRFGDNANGEIYSFALGHALVGNYQGAMGLSLVYANQFNFVWDAPYTWWYGIYELNDVF